MLCCSKCFKEKEKCTQIKGTIICYNCYSNSKLFEKFKLFPVGKCYECNSPLYSSEKHELDKNISLVEYIFSTSETEKITICNKCYKERKKREKCLKRNKQILFFSAIILSVLWLRMLHWETTIKKLFDNYRFEFIVFTVISIFSLLILYISIFNSWQYKSQDKKSKKSR
jgi:hypothetical protein